jgi:hypothetical protein
MAELYNILDELNLTELPDDRKRALMANLSESLSSRILLRVIEVMPEETRQQAEKISAEGTEEELSEFLKTAVPGIDALAYDEYMKMRDELLATNNQAKDRIAELIEEDKAKQEPK